MRCEYCHSYPCRRGRSIEAPLTDASSSHERFVSVPRGFLWWITFPIYPRNVILLIYYLLIITSSRCSSVYRVEPKPSPSSYQPTCNTIMRAILRENPNEVGDYIANYICKCYVSEPIPEPHLQWLIIAIFLICCFAGNQGYLTQCSYTNSKFFVVLSFILQALLCRATITNKDKRIS